MDDSWTLDIDFSSALLDAGGAAGDSGGRGIGAPTPVGPPPRPDAPRRDAVFRGSASSGGRPATRKRYAAAPPPGAQSVLSTSAQGIEKPASGGGMNSVLVVNASRRLIEIERETRELRALLASLQSDERDLLQRIADGADHAAETISSTPQHTE